MYKQLGYIIYRTVLEYYSGDPDEDAYGKSLCQIILDFFLMNLTYFYFSGCFKYLLQICAKHVRAM